MVVLNLLSQISVVPVERSADVVGELVIRDASVLGCSSMQVQLHRPSKLLSRLCKQMAMYENVYLFFFFIVRGVLGVWRMHIRGKFNMHSSGVKAGFIHTVQRHTKTLLFICDIFLVYIEMKCSLFFSFAI